MASCTRWLATDGIPTDQVDACNVILGALCSNSTNEIRTVIQDNVKASLGEIRTALVNATSPMASLAIETSIIAEGMPYTDTFSNSIIEKLDAPKAKAFRTLPTMGHVPP